MKNKLIKIILLVLLFISIGFSIYLYIEKNNLNNELSILKENDTNLNNDINDLNKQIESLNMSIESLDIEDKIKALGLWKRRMAQLKKAES